MTVPPAVESRPLDTLSRSMQAFGRLVSQGRIIETVLRRSRIDLSRADVQVLHTLLEAGNGIRLGDLADRLQLDAPTVTRRVQQLEARHLVRRATDPLDKRAQLVQPTAAGARTIERAMSAFNSWLEEVLADWPGSDREQFVRLLDRFTRDLYTTVECHGH